MDKVFLSPSSWSHELIKEGEKGELLLPGPQVLLKSELCHLELHLFGRNPLKSLPLSAPFLAKNVGLLMR